MSKYGWESGTLTLPSAEVAPLKKVLRDWMNTFHAEVRAEAVRLHKEFGTRSEAKYAERLNTARAAAYEAREQSRWAPTPRAERTALVHMTALTVLDGLLASARYSGTALHQPTVGDVEPYAPRATNRTVSYPMVGRNGYGEATASIEGRDLRWSVPENNHAVENAHEAPLARVLFAHLNRIRWTRGTGGHFVGNDEYNRDQREAGYGGNYLTSTYGPLGEQAKIEDYMTKGFSRAEATRFATSSR